MIYYVIDTRTGWVANRRTYKTIGAAIRAAEKLNQAFGAHRYTYCSEVSK